MALFEKLPPTGKRAPALAPWLFWGSAFWLMLAVIALIVAQTGAFFVLLAPKLAADPNARIDVAAAAQDFETMSALMLASYPAALAVLVLAVRLRRWRAQDYFALYGVTWRQFGYGCAALFGALLVTGFIAMASGRETEPEFMTELFAALRKGGNVWLMFVAIVVAAPIAEEIIFRGFLYRGLAATRAGAMGAVIVTAMLWATIHTQYDAFYMGVIFIIGLVMGGLRAWSGTATLPILLHVLMNGLSFSQAWLPQTS